MCIRDSSKSIQAISEDSGTEVTPVEMWDTFTSTYLPDEPALVLRSHEVATDDDDVSTLTAQLLVDGEAVTVRGSGNGPIAAFVAGLRDGAGVELDVVDYHEHSLGSGSDATAVAYVESIDADGTTRWGVGTHPNIITASLRAVLSAAQRVRTGDAGR